LLQKRVYLYFTQLNAINYFARSGRDVENCVSAPCAKDLSSNPPKI